MEQTQAGKQQQQQKGFKKKISRVFQRSRSTGDQSGEDAQSECKESPAASGRRRSWGSWRQKRSPQPVPPTPLLVAAGDGRPAPTSSFTSLQTNDCIQAEQVTRDSKVVYNYNQIADAIQSTELEPKSPTGKSTKFQNIRFPSSGKAEEGKRNQVLDYLGGIFGSGRKKTSKKSSAVPLSPGNSVEESPPATKDLSSSGQNSPSNVQDSGFSQDHRSEGLIETEVPDQYLAEISPGSPDESCPSAASSDPDQQTVSLPETKKATIIDISLQSTEREPEPKGVGEQLSPEVVHSNPTKEVLSDVSSTLINNLETSSSGCTGAILPSIDRTVKECEIAKPNDTSFNENKSQDSQQQKDNKFVNSDRLTEGQYDCKIDDKCVDIPAIKEYILPISETVRIEQIARVAEIDIHVPKVEVNSSVKLSEASVSLPVNSIGVELKALEKPLKNEENKQLNHSTFQRVKKEIGNPTISEKTSFTPDLAKRQIPSKKDELTAGANKTKVEETGSSCITCIGEDTANLLKVERHPTDNLSGENLNGLVEQESNTDKPVTNSQTNVGHFKNTVEKLDFLDLKFDLNTATLVSFEMDKKSPSDGKRGGRKGRKRRSLKSDQSGQNTGIADTNTIEETLKENDFDVNAVKLTQQSPEVPVKMLPSSKQGTSPLIHRKTLPKSVTFTEKSVEGVSKPFASRKKSSQRGSFSPDNEIESPVKGSSEKTSNSEAQFESSVSVISSHKSTPISGQKVERNNCKSSEGAFVDSTNNEAFNVSLQGAIIDKLGENTIALDSANQNSDVESVSCISNQQSVGHFNVSHSVITQESGADSERLKTQKIKNSKGKGSNKNVITSQLHSTVTTRIRLPSSEKGDESDAQSNPSNQLERCTEIRTEEEETIRITLPKKKSATSHHTVDFFTTKDLPLASNSNKTCVGSLKIQIQNKSARRTDGTLTVIGKRQPNTLKNVEAAAGVKVDTRPKTDEISKVKADDTKHISEEGHRNEGVKTASVHVENTSLKTFDDMDAGSSEASCSLETVSSALCEHNDMKSQTSSVDMQTSEICLTEIEKGITSKSTKRQEQHLDSAVVPLVPAVPSTGAELKSGEMEGKATLLPSVLLSENRKEALTNRVNGSKAIMAEENPGLGQQNTPKVENQDFAVKDTAMPQKVEAPTAVLSDKDKNASLDLNQRGRSSDVIVGTVISAQQSPPTSQSMEDVALSQGSQASKTMSEIEEKSTAKTANERPTDTGITVGKLVQQSSPVLQISDGKAKSSSQPKEMFEKPESEIKTDTSASCAIEQQECLATSAAEDTSTVKLSSSLTQARETEIIDGSASCVEGSLFEKEGAICFSDQKSDRSTGDVVLPLQVGPVNSEHKKKETSLASSLCEQTPEINADISANIISDTESGSNEAAMGPVLPLQQDVSMLQNNDPEVKEKTSLQSMQAFKTMGAVIINEASAKGSNEQTDKVERKEVSLEPVQTFKSAVSEMEKCATTNSVIEHQESLGTAATDGAIPVQLNSPQTQPGKAATKDRPPQCVEISETQNEAQANCFNQQKSGTDTLSRDGVPALQMNSKEINDIPYVCDQAPHIEIATSANVVSDIESGSNEVILESALPLQQITPTVQNVDSEIRETKSFQNLQAFETVEAEISKEESVECSNGQINDCKTKNASPESRQTFKSAGSEMENGMNSNSVNEQQESLERATIGGTLPAGLDSPQTNQRENEKTNTSPQSAVVSNTLTSADLKLPIKQEAVHLPLRESEVNDASVRLQTSAMVPIIGKDVPVSSGDDLEFGSPKTKGALVQPSEQTLSVLENRSFDISGTTSSQSVQLSGAAESDLNEGSSTMVSFEQNGSSEVTKSKFGMPLLSSTPKVQNQKMEPKGGIPALSLEASTRNLSRAKNVLARGPVEERTEPGAPTNENSLYVQNREGSHPGKVIVNEGFVINDACTNKVIVDLESTTNDITTTVEPTASKSQQESDMNVSFNEGSSLDSSSDMDSFTETIRRYGNPIHLPQKRQRIPKVPSTPPFAMPPIQEDQMSPKKEKNFDPSSFKFGLMRNSIRKNEAPASLLKMQQIETKSKVIKRVSAEQSLLFKSLARKKPPFEKHDRVQDDLASASDSKRSRLEMEKTLGQASKLSTEPVVKSADISPSLLNNDADKGFEFDWSSETQLPDNTEKCLKSNTSENESNSVVFASEKHLENGLTTPNLKPNLLEINTNFGAIANTNAFVSEPTFQGLDSLHIDQNLPSLFGADLFTPKSVMPNQPDVGIPEKENLKLNARPGKIIIYSRPRLNGEAFEFFHDVQDATALKLSSEISIRVVRGCWLLYEKPNFEGGRVALEEGIVEMADIWGKKMDGDSSDNTSASNESVIGSIRRIIKEWCLPEIDLCTELNGLGRKTTYFDEMEEIQTYGVLEPTLSLEVFSATWLLFGEPFYQGNSYIVEPGQYPCPESWEAMDPYIGSLRPLKMGTLKVEKLHDHKVIVYEKPFFEGKQLEIKTDVFSFTGEDEVSALCHTYPFASIGSMKVLGGFWVGYEKPGFRGHQYALEEGEYRAWNEWGGYNEHLQSLRFIHIDLSNPVMIMYSEENLSEKSGSIEVVGPVPVLEETEHGLRTMSINVLSGAWVAYENSDFTGEQYILEKGLYSKFEDWGATNCTIASVQPVLVDAMDSELSKFKVKLFSEPEFQGNVQIFDMDAVQFPDGFSPKSCEVLSGSWVAYDAENFTGNQYILEEGTYPNLAAIGCIADACIKSVKTVNFCFSMPDIMLFMREKFEGKKVELISEVLNLKLEGYNTHIFSVKVNGGIWVAYEGSNYKGRQVLLQPSKIPSWHQHTGWHGIGSLRPLIQRRVYFRVRNRGTGAFLTLTGELTDINMIRVQASEDTGMDDQIWFYQDGYIKSKVAEDCCLDATGSLLGVGSRLGISILHSKDIQIWSISSDGVIWNCIRTELVIDIKGGQHYDKNQTILSKFDEVRPTQRWDLDIV